MDFELSDEQEAIRRAAEEFAQGELTTERVDEMTSGAQYPWDMLKKAANLGFIGLHFPEKYGGQGYGLLEKVLVIQSFCRQDPSLGITLSLSDVGAQWILYDGSDEQKERVLPPVARGETVLSVGLTPMGTGTLDDNPVKSTANRDMAILNGKEPLVINGGLARQIVIFEKFGRGKRRAFIVETEQKGVVLEPSEPRMGVSFMPVRGIRFEEVPVSSSNSISRVETKAHSALQVELAAQSIGMAWGAFDRALEYAKKREAFGSPVIEFQALNHELADLETRLEASKWLVYHAAWKLDQGDPDPRLASMAKLYGSMMATDLIRGAIQAHGGYGFLIEYGLERIYRDAWFIELFGGTAGDQKDTIAGIWLEKAS
ncbi:MAG: acyl-CoA dehydrogenase [Proteobacteria bacterium]|nr:acyl-CoA dehydrogenase [Pseudomonadota bacterium]